MKLLLAAALILSLLVPVAFAEEASGEVNVSWVDPYNKIVPGFLAAFSPEFLTFNRLSLGAGIAIHVSSRFKYGATPWIEFEPEPEFQTDSTSWYYYDENFVELVNYEMFTETRFQLVGASDDAHWKGWLTLHLGYVDYTGRRTQFTEVAEQWEYVDSLGVDQFEIVANDRFTFNYKTEHDATFYLSPGILVGIGNFIVGYRHLFYLDDKTLIKGEPARNLGTIRVGYRFIW